MEHDQFLSTVEEGAYDELTADSVVPVYNELIRPYRRSLHNATGAGDYIYCCTIRDAASIAHGKYQYSNSYRKASDAYLGRESGYQCGLCR